jgi:hypothetical protein
VRQLMQVTPTSRFHRTVRKLERCADAATTDLGASYAALLSSDKPIGIYRGDARTEDILFTENAWIFTDSTGKARRIEYREIQWVKFPSKASDSVDLLIQIANASTATLRVVGRQGNFRDVSQVGRFFMRVAEDTGKANAIDSKRDAA